MDVEPEEEAEPQGGWEWVKTQEEKRKKEREEVCGFVCNSTANRNSGTCELTRVWLF